MFFHELEGLAVINTVVFFDRNVFSLYLFSVADPGCLSRILIFTHPGSRILIFTHPGSRILIFTHPGSRIPDPKTATKESGEKKFDVIPFYVATKFTKLYIILVLKC